MSEAWLQTKVKQCQEMINRLQRENPLNDPENLREWASVAEEAAGYVEGGILTAAKNRIVRLTGEKAYLERRLADAERRLVAAERKIQALEVQRGEG